MVETDCPYLAPEPHRGKRCEPAYTRLVAESIAAGARDQPRGSGARHDRDGGRILPVEPLVKVLAKRLAALILLSLGASCTTPDRHHQVIISIPDQRMALIEDGKPIATYPVSTSKFGVGDIPGTSETPLGDLEIARKIGGGAPSGAVFKDRRRTGEIVPPDAPGRDPIVTRILWLRGLEPRNARAFSRYIYIHGTPEERNIGLPASYGCIRMRSRDVLQLFDIVGTRRARRDRDRTADRVGSGVGSRRERVWPVTARSHFRRFVRAFARGAFASPVSRAAACRHRP